MRKLIIILSLLSYTSFSQYNFNYSTTGQRVCLVNTTINTSTPSITINLLDYADNSSNTTDIYRRQLEETTWTLVAENLSAGTQNWTDTDVDSGDVYEYQVKREDTWTFSTVNYDAVGYTVGALKYNNSNYQGRMILLVADNIVTNLPGKFDTLKMELTASGWLVEVLMVDKAASWDSGDDVVGIRSSIQSIYTNAPVGDKPKVLFILGHVPMPRAGTDEYSPDGHTWNQGARGADSYYADINGSWTDALAYNPGGLTSSLQINAVGDYKWDDGFLPSDIEMAFGRVDFEDLLDVAGSEETLISNYLDKLSEYKNVVYDMGDKAGFYYGSYHNSNDAAFRSLFSLVKADSIIQNYSGGTHPQWVAANGPFKIYMQNEFIPVISEWNTYGMNATVYTSDQSSYGFGDVPQEGGYELLKIRALLATNTRCLASIWSSTSCNVFFKTGAGISLGQSLKDVINHNTVNNYLEKPQQSYDQTEGWNRTVFELWGDPTINLYQIAPPGNVDITNISDEAVISWTASPDENVIGYSVYEADSMFGKYTNIDGIITDTEYTISTYQFGKWYMVKALKIEETGGGAFIGGSLGIMVEGDIEISETTIPNTTKTTSLGDIIINGLRKQVSL